MTGHPPQDLERLVAERTEALRNAMERAEAASRAKSNFLAGMSHELRTPLNSIIGFSEVLTEGHFGQLNEKQREFVEDILASGKRLLGLVNDILQLTSFDARKEEL